MGEIAPGGTNARMTAAQVKVYLKNMKKAKAIAQAKLDSAKASGELNKDKKDLEKLEDLLNA